MQAGDDLGGLWRGNVIAVAGQPHGLSEHVEGRPFGTLVARFRFARVGVNVGELIARFLRLLCHQNSISITRIVFAENLPASLRAAPCKGLVCL